MSQIQIAPVQSAISTNYLDTSAYQFVMICAPVTSTDTVTVQALLPDGQSAVSYPDVNGSVSGLASATQCRIYYGGPMLVISKVGTASTAGIYAYFASREV